MGALTLHFLVLTLSGWFTRKQFDVVRYLMEENCVLREQLRGRRLRFTDEQRRRLAVRAKALSRQVLLGLNCIVTPDTLLRWYRQLVARKYDGSQVRGAGRPSTPGEIAKLVTTMATDNPTWGYSRIRGALFNVGHDIARSTIARILVDAGLEPAPERKRQPRWKEFLKAHFNEMAATDFFTVEVLTAFGIVRYTVMFVIELGSRRVHIAGITHSPCGAWTEQIARNLTDPVDGFLRGIRYLIHDRDTLFTERFAGILQSGGVQSVKLPAHSPNLNAFAERFVRSIRCECLDRVIPLSEKHLRHVVSQYLEHYLLERNHQGLGNRLITGPPAANLNAGHPVKCRERLGGLLRYYHREAA